ncbi:hypothetical protein DV737_g2285, partial [Chaetothyriales sp. CBS 132003]
MEVAQYPQSHFISLAPHNGTSLDMRNLAGALPSVPQPPYHQYPSPPISNQHPQYHFQHGQQFAGQTASNFNANLSAQYSQHYLPAEHRQPHMQHFPHGFANPNLQVSHGLGGGQPYGQPPIYGGRIAPYQASQQRINGVPVVRKTSSNSSLQTSGLRGPPRKPKQSGHALWVGNLPPGAQIIDLKDHFSSEATDDIESVFLISKSNCAFVNYKTEASCTAAMVRFHDSRFQGVRLVCRLRRGSNCNPVTPQPSSVPPVAASQSASPAPETSENGATPDQPEVDAEPAAEPEEVAKVKEKFFVVKSLTIEDLERSVTAENVYLIFSANKSGEYFGYARMDSAIDDEASSKLEMPVRPEANAEVNASDLPLTILTPATATAPKGRIIDDSARGTIFWEADNGDEEDSGNTSGESYESGAQAVSANAPTPQTFGRPFKIVWMSTERLPFYRTRGLRNPWNANREVKIARDGTEIEPSVGGRLVSMFHKPQPPSPVNVRPPTGMMPQGYMGLPIMPGALYGRSY